MSIETILKRLVLPAGHFQTPLQLMMCETIMTEKIARRAVHVPTDYNSDYLSRITVGNICSRAVITLDAAQHIDEVKEWLDDDSASAQHLGFPVCQNGKVIGMVTRKDQAKAKGHNGQLLSDILTKAPLIVQEDHSVREAADHMVEADVGRLIVVDSRDASRLVGIITRGDILADHSQRIRGKKSAYPSLTQVDLIQRNHHSGSIQPATGINPRCRLTRIHNASLPILNSRDKTAPATSTTKV